MFSLDAIRKLVTVFFKSSVGLGPQSHTAMVDNVVPPSDPLLAK